MGDCAADKDYEFDELFEGESDNKPSELDKEYDPYKDVRVDINASINDIKPFIKNKDNLSYDEIKLE